MSFRDLLSAESLVGSLHKTLGYVWGWITLAAKEIFTTYKCVDFWVNNPPVHLCWILSLRKMNVSFQVDFCDDS